ncbi:hypothetical protein Z043_122701, partial [Scleropages formosus]
TRTKRADTILSSRTSVVPLSSRLPRNTYKKGFEDGLRGYHITSDVVRLQHVQLQFVLYRSCPCTDLTAHLHLLPRPVAHPGNFTQALLWPHTQGTSILQVSGSSGRRNVPISVAMGDSSGSSVQVLPPFRGGKHSLCRMTTPPHPSEQFDHVTHGNHAPSTINWRDPQEWLQGPQGPQGPQLRQPSSSEGLLPSPIGSFPALLRSLGMVLTSHTSDLECGGPPYLFESKTGAIEAVRGAVTQLLVVHTLPPVQAGELTWAAAPPTGQLIISIWAVCLPIAAPGQWDAVATGTAKLVLPAAWGREGHCYVLGVGTGGERGDTGGALVTGAVVTSRQPTIGQTIAEPEPRHAGSIGAGELTWSAAFSFIRDNKEDAFAVDGGSEGRCTSAETDVLIRARGAVPGPITYPLGGYALTVGALQLPRRARTPPLVAQVGAVLMPIATVKVRHAGATRTKELPGPAALAAVCNGAVIREETVLYFFSRSIVNWTFQC